MTTTGTPFAYSQDLNPETLTTAQAIALLHQVHQWAGSEQQGDQLPGPVFWVISAGTDALRAAITDVHPHVTGAPVTDLHTATRILSLVYRFAATQHARQSHRIGTRWDVAQAVLFAAVQAIDAVLV